MAKSLIGDDEIATLMAQELNNTQIAKWFTERGRSITQQAISMRVRRILERDMERTKYVLPWMVRSPEHAQGWVWRAVLAYAKMRKGRGVSAQDIKLARSLEDFLFKEEAVVTYDWNKGFMLRDRRPEDGASLLV